MRRATAASLVGTLVLTSTSVLAVRNPAAATPPGEDGRMVLAVVDGSEIELFLHDPDEPGGGYEQVENAIDGPAADIAPSFSKGGLVAYADLDESAPWEPQRVVTQAPGTSRGTFLAGGSISDRDPAWSPDGSRIAFTTEVSRAPAPCVATAEVDAEIAFVQDGVLRAVRRDGTGSRAIGGTETFGSAGVDWRPDGGYVVVATEADGLLLVAERTGTTSGLGPKAAYTPAVSPDGTKVAYTLDDVEQEDAEIWVVDVESGDRTKLTDNDADDLEPAWSCDGQTLLFSSDRGGEDSDIWRMASDGTGAANLTDTDGWDEFAPTASPTGDRIAFSSDQHGDLDIMVMRADASNAADPLHLTTSSQDDDLPSWSPDGTRIAYTSAEKLQVVSATTPDQVAVVPAPFDGVTALSWGPPMPTTHVATMRADGSDLQVVTLSIAGGDPAWSPDGARIAFTDRGTVFSIQPDGRGLAQVTPTNRGPGGATHPSYSPDGTQLAFASANAQGASNLFVLNVAGGTGLRALTTGTADVSPVWSPSGTRIGFLRGGDVYTVKPDGTGITEVSDLDEDEVIGLDWGSTGPPDTQITEKPGEAIGEGSATFRFTATAFPASFECKLSGDGTWAGQHDWRDCGSMASSGATQPTVSYQSVPKGRFTFMVRATAGGLQDPSPATWQFESFPPELVVGKLGSGVGAVSLSPSGGSCGQDQDECRFGVRGQRTLKATPQAGSRFAGWSGACSGTGTCSVTVGTKPVFANARFELDPDTFGRCSQGTSLAQQVGQWFVRGCFAGSGPRRTATEPVTLNGLGVVPIGGELTLDTGARRLTSSGRALLVRPPSRVGGTAVDAVVLAREVLTVDLGSPNLVGTTPTGTVAGMALEETRTVVVSSDGGKGATTSLFTTLPDVLGAREAQMRFTTRDATTSGGDYDLFVEDADGMTSRFTAVVGEWIGLAGTTMRYTPKSGWTVAASLDVPGSAGTLSGTFTFRDGAVVASTLTARGLALGGLLDMDVLRLSTTDGSTWSLDSGGAAARRTSHLRDCGSLVDRSSSNFILQGKNLQGGQLVIGSCSVAGGLVQLRNVRAGFGGIGLGNIRFTITGSVAGRATGDFTGTVNYLPPLPVFRPQSSMTVDAALDTLRIDDIATFSDVRLTWDSTDSRTTRLRGSGTVDDVQDAAVTFDLGFDGAGQLSTAAVTVDELGLFDVLDTTTQTAEPLFSVRNLVLGYTAGSRGWTVGADVQVPGATVSRLSGEVVMGQDGSLESGGLRIGSARILGVLQASQVELAYTSDGDWSGVAYLEIPTLAGVGGRFSVVDGRLDSLDATLTLSQPTIPTPIPHFSLYRLRYGFANNPPSVVGGLGAQFGPTIAGIRPVTVDGDLRVRRAEGSQKAGFRVEGAVKLMNLQLGDAYVDYTHPGTVRVRGCLGTCSDGLTLGPAKVKGTVGGAFQPDPFAFQVDGSATAQINLESCFIKCGVVKIGVTGKAVVSSVGVAVCGGIDGWDTSWQAGLGYRWGGSQRAFTGCDLAEYAPFGLPRTAARGVVAARTTVPAGQPVQAFRFTGTTAPPLVDLRRPDGTLISVTADGLGQQGDHLVTVDEESKETVILVDSPEPGEWSYTLRPGSSPLASAQVAEGLPDPEVSATVTGSGSTRVLTWQLDPLDGQVVRFVELGEDASQVVAETSAATGSVEFTPAAGAAGQRTIVAEFVQDDLPRANLDVATYDVENRALASISVRGGGRVSSDLAGIDCRNVCEHVLSGPTTLTAVPEAGWVFTGWTGDCGGIGACGLVGDTSVRVVGVFEKAPKPRLGGLRPGKAAVGDTVVLAGKGLTFVDGVRIGKLAVPSFTTSPRSVAFVVPPGARTGKVSVSSPGGRATTKGKLVVKKDDAGRLEPPVA